MTLKLERAEADGREEAETSAKAETRRSAKEIAQREKDAEKSSRVRGPTK